MTKTSNWSAHVGFCRNCRTTVKQHYAKGLCFDCYKSDRLVLFLQDYINGEKLTEIAKRTSVTTSRAQQRFSRAVKTELEILGVEPTSENMTLMREVFKNQHKFSRDSFKSKNNQP